MVPPPPPPIDYAKSFRDGAIGGVGAVPGTFCAHFCDVIKMRQQLTGERLASAIRGIYRAGGGGGSNFFAGAIPAVQQKVATRSTMFLASSASVQFFEHRLGFTPMSAAFVGSATSGYITGSIASPWEWQKVLVSQRVNSPATGKGVWRLLGEARKRHGGGGVMACVGRRMHAAGVRNAIFDSTFFGVKRIIEDYSSGSNKQQRPFVSTGFAYGIAAVTAVTVDYAVDVSVKRTYAIGPDRSIPSLGVIHHTLHIVSNEGFKLFRGLGVKSVEFGISYMITGLMAPHIARMIDALFKDEKSLNAA